MVSQRPGPVGPALKPKPVTLGLVPRGHDRFGYPPRPLIPAKAGMSGKEREDGAHIAAKAPAILFDERDSRLFRQLGRRIVIFPAAPSGRVIIPARSLTSPSARLGLLDSLDCFFRSPTFRVKLHPLARVQFTSRNYLAKTMRCHKIAPIALSFLRGAISPSSPDQAAAERPASAGASSPSVRARTTGTATASPISFSAALSLAGRR